MRELPVCGRGPLSPKGRKLFPVGERNIALVGRYLNQELRYQLERAVATLNWPSSGSGVSKYVCIALDVSLAGFVPNAAAVDERRPVK